MNVSFEAWRLKGVTRWSRWARCGRDVPLRGGVQAGACRRAHVGRHPSERPL